mmetsp:Transcript_61888/g.144989  ORF Transcript_61888/g.144989 Transcript_61888/m.144989 type:complete len:291 (-) Transcript_61888:259-1131(-)
MSTSPSSSSCTSGCVGVGSGSIASMQMGHCRSSPTNCRISWSVKALPVNIMSRASASSRSSGSLKVPEGGSGSFTSSRVFRPPRFPRVALPCSKPSKFSTTPSSLRFTSEGLSAAIQCLRSSLEAAPFNLSLLPSMVQKKAAEDREKEQLELALAGVGGWKLRFCKPLPDPDAVPEKGAGPWLEAARPPYGRGGTRGMGPVMILTLRTKPVFRLTCASGESLWRSCIWSIPDNKYGECFATKYTSDGRGLEARNRFSSLCSSSEKGTNCEPSLPSSKQKRKSLRSPQAKG